MKEAGSHKGFLGFNLLGMTWSGHQLFQFLANMTTGQDERKVVTDAIKSPSSRYGHSLLSLPPRSDWRTKRGGSEAVRMEIPYYHESPVNVVTGGRSRISILSTRPPALGSSVGSEGEEWAVTTMRGTVRRILKFKKDSFYYPPITPLSSLSYGSERSELGSLDPFLLTSFLRAEGRGEVGRKKGCEWWSG